MDKISYSLELRREAAEQMNQMRKCSNLQRTASADMLFAPAILGFAIFSMGFAAGVMWMGWWR